MSDGHYNIYAYDANTNQMLIGPNKKLSGNVVGGVFTPDAGSRLELEAGTYKFVCCTDDVSLDPTYGTGSLGINVKKDWCNSPDYPFGRRAADCFPDVSPRVTFPFPSDRLYQSAH